MSSNSDDNDRPNRQLAGASPQRPRGCSTRPLLNGSSDPARDSQDTNKKNRLIAGSQTLLEQLEAENAELRDKAVDLALQIQAFRDGNGHFTAS